ncbi:MAG TPA: Hsp20/alpha crystallin family protein [Vicinamibacteria bacterium]|nr:Hsp20/alpha crystallin family protein [Vicinamibacteria bacterium]
MPVAHWDPVRELLALQERMNRLIDQTLSRTHTEGDLSTSGSWSPAVDVYESDTSLVLQAELPDVEQPDIEVRVDEDRLTLRGERRLKHPLSEKHFLRMERSYGPFNRTFALPASVDADRVTAEFKRGVLTVTLPKQESEKSRQIPIG